MRPFEDAPEFVDLDNRQFRQFNPISKQQMQHKHEALLPPELLKGKTVLDLGSCMGATGHWALTYGASHYTGVELQGEYIDLCRPLFEKYHPGRYTLHVSSIEDWLAKDSSTYDVVCMLGVIYAFVDYYPILKRMSEMSRDIIAIDGLYHSRLNASEDFCGVEFTERQTINLSNIHASLIGRGSRISPKGFEFLMSGFGFQSTGVIDPKPLTHQTDIYHLPKESKIPSRYLIRFHKGGSVSPSLAEDLAGERTGMRVTWS